MFSILAALRKQRQADLCEFNRAYLASFMAVRAKERGRRGRGRRKRRKEEEEEEKIISKLLIVILCGTCL